VQALVFLLAFAAAPVGLAVAAPPACAASVHHAALIVDTGSGPVRQFCVGFTEDTITGKDVLDRAGMNPPPVYHSYGANGVAVCALLGVGRDADHCLESGNNWAYYRATGGATAFSYSDAGASSTTVHDGDVEGWKWEAAPMPPAFTPAGQVCPASSPSPPPSDTTAGGVTHSTPGPTAGAGTRPTVAPPPTTVAGPAAMATSTTPPEPSATTSTSTTAAAGRGQVAASRRASASGGGGGSAWSLALFGVMLAGLLGWLVWSRRARRRRAT
jgi:hypothetical protein